MTGMDSGDGERVQIYAVAYASRACRPMTVAEIDQIVIEANAHNAMQQVTGALLYDGSGFFQYFEGPREGVGRIYERIKRSSKHVLSAEVFNGPVGCRYFTQWYMASKQAGHDTLLELGTARWAQVTGTLEGQAGESEGLRRLLAFWGQGQASAALAPA